MAVALVSDGDMRDRFLRALDARDRATAVRLASYLTQSTNPLPSETSAQLGLPHGSSYAAAARLLLAPDTSPPDVAEPIVQG